MPRKPCTYNFFTTYLHSSCTNPNKMANLSPLQKKVHKSFSLVRSYLYLFFATSSIHGLARIPPSRIHTLERLLWYVLVALGVYFTATLGRQTFARFEQNPTVISIERDSLAWNTSFPSVTVCPNEKLNDGQLNRY